MNGSLFSPLFPKDYPPNLNWQTEIVVSKGYFVSLSFLKFDIETSKNCTKDFVQVMDSHVLMKVT